MNTCVFPKVSWRGEAIVPHNSSPKSTTVTTTPEDKSSLLSYLFLALYGHGRSH